MRKKRLARQARLRLVLLGGKIIGAAKELKIVTGSVAAELVHQLDEAQVNGAPGGRRKSGFVCRVHGSHYSNASEDLQGCKFQKGTGIFWNRRLSCGHQ